MDELVSIVQACTRLAFSELFGNKEHFYYCVLLVTGEGYAPTISAWSWEALDRECAKQEAEHLRGELMWSYADSPYYAFGKEFFLPVQHHLSLRPSIDELSDEEWDKEWQDRMLAYERAMKNLDEEGFWGQGETRKQVYKCRINAHRRSRYIKSYKIKSQLRNSKRLVKRYAISI